MTSLAEKMTQQRQWWDKLWLLLLAAAESYQVSQVPDVWRRSFGRSGPAVDSVFSSR